MRQTAWALLMVVAAAIVPATGALAANAGQAATVLVFGDSISAAYGMPREQGWVALLAQRLAELGPGHAVVNASVSGETTSGGAARLPAALAVHDPDLVIIELGGNDGLRGTPVASIRRNLGRMIEAADPTTRQVLLVPMQLPPNYGRRYTEQFRNLFAEVAEAHGVPLAASFIDAVALNPELMQRDGVHPNAQAQPALLEALWPAILSLLGD